MHSHSTIAVGPKALVMHTDALRLVCVDAFVFSVLVILLPSVGRLFLLPSPLSFSPLPVIVTCLSTGA